MTVVQLGAPLDEILPERRLSSGSWPTPACGSAR